MKLLITGGTGYLGRALVAAATARGFDPVVFARTARSSGLAARLIDGDIRDADAVTAAAQGCDAICHTAALVTIWRRRKQDFDDVNVGGLQNVINAARREGIRRIVYTSSFLALPPSDSGRATGTTISAPNSKRTRWLRTRSSTACPWCACILESSTDRDD